MIPLFLLKKGENVEDEEGGEENTTKTMMIAPNPEVSIKYMVAF